MFETRPYALVIDRDETGRAQLTGLLRECGFVVAGFRESRGALSALFTYPVDLAIVAGDLPGGSDALAVARQMRHCRPESRVLFTGAADGLPDDPGPDSGCVVTRPFDKRGFLSAVLALVGRDGDAANRRDEAELGLIEAELACLYNRQSRAVDGAAALNVAHQIRDALATRGALHRALDAAPEAG
jgi:DNA-binding response OmpR family regulator